MPGSSAEAERRDPGDVIVVMLAGVSVGFNSGVLIDSVDDVWHDD